MTLIDKALRLIVLLIGVYLAWVGINDLVTVTSWADSFKFVVVVFAGLVLITLAVMAGGEDGEE